jgi:Icc-related predicted phosphoesterase
MFFSKLFKVTTKKWEDIEPTQIFTNVPIQTEAYNPETHIRIACISDTHSKHRNVTTIPPCDLLIHTGDFTRRGEISTIQDLSDYFGQILQNHDSSSATTSSVARPNKVREIICIAGNHDLSFQCATTSSSSTTTNDAISSARPHLRNCTYLQDESYLWNNCINIYGSPWTPSFGYGWAFNLPRNEIHTKWDKIPNDTDILLTHGPPLGRGDLCFSNNRAGCENLLQQVQTRIKPRIHIFGHIHEAAGVSTDGVTLFVNACSFNLQFQPNPCIVIDLPLDKNLPALLVEPTEYSSYSKESVHVSGWLDRLTKN